MNTVINGKPDQPLYRHSAGQIQQPRGVTGERPRDGIAKTLVGLGALIREPGATVWKMRLESKKVT